MITETCAWSLIETGKWGTLSPRIFIASMAQGICIVWGAPVTFDWCAAPRPE